MREWSHHMLGARAVALLAKISVVQRTQESQLR
jgi:hypothetical protein